MRKAQHLQPKASDIADAEVGCFAFSRLAAHIRVLSKSGEKPTVPAKRVVGTTKYSEQNHNPKEKNSN
jgi:hypothetical protein